MSDRGVDSGGGDGTDDELDVPATPARGPGEGVRIIGAEEAAAALETGQVGTRRPDDAPRFGDRPAAPTGPRPRHRFPLTDPTEVMPREADPTPTPTSHDLPHWTEPPTGEVPRILAGDPPPEDEDDAAWQTFTTRAPRWRDQQTDWDEADFDDVAVLGDEARVGALDDTRTPHSDLFSFDEDPVPTPPPSAPGPPAAPVGAPRQQRVRAEPRPAVEVPERNLATAVATGVIVAVLALIVFRAGPGPTMALATVVVTIAAVELFDALRRGGYRPATLLGLTATVSVMLAAYSKGETAIPLVLTLTMVCGLLWFLMGVIRARPTMNVAATLLGFTWVGFLGSFSALLLRMPERRGIAFLLGAVLATVAYDVGGYFAGSRSGRTPLAPTISPNKTWEGLFGGAFAAVFVSVLITRMVHPWTFGSALALGLVVAVLAPLGDLCESMIKRDLGIKDMGTILPGHGGMMDRFDALLFVLPATYYLVHLLDLA